MKSKARKDSNKKQREIAGAKVEGKIQCLICLHWYWKPMAHVWQRHKISAREYKEEYNLEVTKGIVPDWHRKILSKNALDNKMDEQLMRVGMNTRLKKGHSIGKYERSPITIAKLQKNRMPKKSNLK